MSDELVRLREMRAFAGGGPQHTISKRTRVVFPLVVGTLVPMAFLTASTLKILGPGVLAFALHTAAGILFAKTLNLAGRGRFNPLLGAS